MPNSKKTAPHITVPKAHLKIIPLTEPQHGRVRGVQSRADDVIIEIPKMPKLSEVITMSNNKKTAPGGAQDLHVRNIPADIYNSLREISYNEHVSMNKIINDILAGKRPAIAVAQSAKKGEK